MSPDIYFWFALLTKMGTAALFVIAATVTAERAGPAIGALVATLPVSAGPAYVFLALDHDATFISEAALASFVLNAATALFAVAYVLLVQRFGFAVSVPGAFAVWLGAVALLASVPWSTLSAILLNLAAFPVCFLLVRDFRHVRVPPTRLRWYDFALRALLVAFLVAAVVTLSFRIGARWTGILAAFPVVFTSIMLILHRRIGGRAAAAVLASAMLGLAGFGAAVLTLHLLALPFGSPAALAWALAVSIGWNFVLFAFRQRGVAA